MAGPRRGDGESRPSIFLSGPSRAGKSVLARALLQRHGYHHVALDLGVPDIYRIKDAPARAALRSALYDALIARCAKGYVIEGHDLILVDRWYASGMLGYEPVDLAALARLAARCGGRPFIVGCADVPISAVAQAMRSESSWIASERATYLDTYAADLVEASATLRDLADASGVRYVELDPRGLPATADAAADCIATGSE
jgi:hypothetical protein